MLKLLNKVEDDYQFHKLVYYMKSFKTPPHDGVFRCNCSNYFIRNTYDAREKAIIYQELPKPVLEYSNKLKLYISEYGISIEELLSYCFATNIEYTTDTHFNNSIIGLKQYLAIASDALIPKSVSDGREVIATMACLGEVRFQDVFDVDINSLSHVFTLILLMLNLYTINSIDDILEIEELKKPHNKYGLSNITRAKFYRQSFELDNYNYLYNAFFNTSVKSPSSVVPETLEELELDRYSDRELYMRCDKTLAVPNNEFVSSAGTGFERWRGKDIKIDFSGLSIVDNMNNPVTVEYDPVSLNKLLVKVQPGNNNTDNYYSISVEELWNPNSFNSGETVFSNFIHGCLYQNGKFDHFDYSINQYDLSSYKEKYVDNYSSTGVAIDKYADIHYKVWCVTGETLGIALWINLVLATISDPFKELFLKAIKTYNQIKE